MQSRPPSPFAWLGFALGLLALIALPLAGFGSRWGWWPFGTGFQILRWAAYAGMAAVPVSLIGALAARPGTGRGGLGLAFAGILLGLAASGVPYMWLRTARHVPPIHDISTDTENPPAFRAVLPLRAGARNAPEYGGPDVAKQQHQAYPDIQPLHLAVPPGAAWRRALDAARGMGWAIDAADSADGRIEATATTRWFGFKDDVVIRVTPDSGGSRVDVRSESRVGGSDVGTNARRIRAYLGRLRS